MSDVMARLRALRQESDDSFTLAPGVLVTADATQGATYLVVEAAGAQWRCLRVSYDSQFAGPLDVVCDSTTESVGARRIHGQLGVLIPRDALKTGHARLEDGDLLSDAKACLRAHEEGHSPKTVYPTGRRALDGETHAANEAHRREHRQLVNALATAGQPSLAQVMVTRAKLWWADLAPAIDEGLVFAADAISDDELDAGLLDPANEDIIFQRPGGTLGLTLAPGDTALASWAGAEAPSLTIFSSSAGVCHSVTWSQEDENRFSASIPWAPGAAYFFDIDGETIQVTFPQ